MTTTTAPSLRIEQLPIDALRPDPANPRRIDDDELEALTRSMRRFGLVQPILARTDGMVIGGHQRLLAARRLGLATVPVIRVDLPEDQARLLGLALNRIGGSWDETLLARLLADLGSGVELDLSLSGFGEDEVRDLLRTLEAREKRDRPEAFDLDEALEQATREPRTSLGDLWHLGEHRLLCGDATAREDVTRALADRGADMCFTDPPYNVSLGDHGGQGRARKRRIANDALGPVAWEAFVRAWAGTLLASVMAPCTCACPARSCRSSRASLQSRAATGVTRSSGPRTASRSGAPTTSALMSRSGMAGAKARSGSGMAVVTRTMSGASTGRRPRRSIRR